VFDVAILWRGREATVPWDKVFGLRGLWDPNVELSNTDKRSYETSVTTLYSAFTIDIILDEKGLGPLVHELHIERGKRTRNIPSWATDMKGCAEYSVDLVYRRWGDETVYNACGENLLDKQTLLEAVALQSHHFNMLGLMGIMIDTVEVLAPGRLIKSYYVAISDVVISQTLRDWLDLARSHSRSGDFSNDAFRRIVVDDAS
jgi:hypothetical protein